MYLASRVDAWRPIVEFVRKQGAVAGMQLAHSGRKGSTKPPWLGGKKVLPEEGGWEPVAPSTEPFDKDYPVPRALAAGEVREIVGAFRRAAERAFAAGFEVLEIHSAHGYLLHEFLSPSAIFGGMNLAAASRIASASFSR
jgi:2,4-dienoyl-CoA reductase-like NADH-dependent reductase (Old Yellow Enzyme family)